MIIRKKEGESDQNNQTDKKYFRELVEVLCILARDQALFEDFLNDLLTPKELKEISKRWQIVKFLELEIPHHEIAKRLRTAVVTVSRGSREMQDSEGGFRRALRKLSHPRP